LQPESLLLSPSTALVRPHCDKSFSVEQGFAKQALESIAAASSQGIEALPQRERQAVERRVKELAAALGQVVSLESKAVPMAPKVSLDDGNRNQKSGGIG
jgi:hypothetical protein